MIRQATDADAPALAELEARAWRWAYVDVVAEERMIGVEERVARWTGQDGVFVAEAGGRVVGVVQASDGELKGLYVEPAAQGAGLGTTLYDFACERLRAAGYAEAVLWVFEGNGHARGFFERRGWAPDGERGEAAGAPELRYRQNLGA
ncbi:MAG TPA: GNAT family N-acetyltransferase [Baekduia sp.]|uniref:GNAT family N-acetyltransferase n=1 Tax=Baekduia sp. TaxID=2600305 RepID=UPI002D79813B|nr:GNAT family N-acetyltransferase [Baekduia sp.]HET6509244.1 GNAT family N-acetyltransferase [Baekduia sp.]